MMIIEFRTTSKAQIWVRFYPAVADPAGFVAERNAHWGWDKYRTQKAKRKKVIK